MIVEQSATIAAPVSRVWDFVMDVPSVASCLPGAEPVTPMGSGVYAGALVVRLGPISARLEGKLSLIEQNRETWCARMNVQATDRRLGGAVNGTMTLQLAPLDDERTELHVHTDAAVLGKLGQLGQGVIRRQADQLVRDFAHNVARTLATGPNGRA